MTRAALLRVGRAAARAALLAVTVAACSLGGSPSSNVVAESAHRRYASGGTAPSPSSGGTGTSSATDKATSSAKATSTGTGDIHRHGDIHQHGDVDRQGDRDRHADPSADREPVRDADGHAEVHPAVTHHATTTPSHYYPVGPPQTGGGGTAGLQDVTLFGVGGAAILAGFASLAYRRRLTRKRRAEDDTRPAAPTHTTVP